MSLRAERVRDRVKLFVSSVKTKLARHSELDLAAAVRYIAAQKTGAPSAIDQIDLMARRTVEYLSLGRSIEKDDFPPAILKLKDRLFKDDFNFYLYLGCLVERLSTAGRVNHNDFIRDIFKLSKSDKLPPADLADQIYLIMAGQLKQLDLKDGNPIKLADEAAWLVQQGLRGRSALRGEVLKSLAEQLYQERLGEQIRFLWRAAKALGLDELSLTHQIRSRLFS